MCLTLNKPAPRLRYVWRTRRQQLVTQKMHQSVHASLTHINCTNPPNPTHIARSGHTRLHSAFVAGCAIHLATHSKAALGYGFSIRPCFSTWIMASHLPIHSSCWMTVATKVSVLASLEIQAAGRQIIELEPVYTLQNQTNVTHTYCTSAGTTRSLGVARVLVQLHVIRQDYNGFPSQDFKSGNEALALDLEVTFPDV